MLGSTGSIGRQACEVVRREGHRIVGLAAGNNLEALAEQVAEFSPALVSVEEARRGEAERLGVKLASPGEVAELECDAVVAAIPGLAGLEPVRRALAAGRRVALANKESMVVAGPLIWELVARCGGSIVPVDSEHSGLYQCLVGEPLGSVAELILTASGGPFRSEPADLRAVSKEMALRHPTWRMGAKVTIDSATLMNKGLEILEAAELFGFPLEQIRVLIQPQSLIHALVRFVDGNYKAQLAQPSMELPIAYALGCPGMRWPGDVAAGHRAAFAGAPLPLGSFELGEPDLLRFPALSLATEAGRRGGLARVALNAADEVAVAAFLAGRLDFPGISRVIEEVLAGAPSGPLDWSSIASVDAWARRRAEELL